MSLRDINDSSDALCVSNLLRVSGTPFDCVVNITDGINHHGMTHASIRQVAMTNEYYNVREGNNDFRLNGISISLPAGRYSTIDHAMSALEEAITASVVGVTVRPEAVPPNLAWQTDAHKTHHTTLAHPTTSMSLTPGLKRLTPGVLNDVERMFGFSKPQTGTTIVSASTYNINHLRDVRILTDLGDGKYGGLVTVLHHSGNTMGDITIRNFNDVIQSAIKLRNKHLTHCQMIATDIHGAALQGDASLSITVQLFRLPEKTAYGKRIRLL